MEVGTDGNYDRKVGNETLVHKERIRVAGWTGVPGTLGCRNTWEAGGQGKHQKSRRVQKRVI